LEEYYCKNLPKEHITSLERGQQKLGTDWNSSLQNALTSTQKGNQDFVSTLNNPEEEGGEFKIRVIPGGRYGCSQFVKICGPPLLQEASIGSIS